MAEENQEAPRPGRATEGHPLAPNPEQHLLEAHKLAIQVQGKEGPTGQAVWALVREERGKTKTLAVHRGTHHEAVTHFYAYLHPAGSTPAPAPSRRGGGPRRSVGGPPPGRRGGGPGGRSGGRPSGGPGGRPSGGPGGRPRP